MMDRREFLKALTLASAAPLWVRLGPLAATAAEAAVPTPDRLLLVLYLAGGNDGLNTIAPYENATYKKLRPDLALRSSEVFPLGGGFGLHRSMPTLNTMWKAGQVAVVHNVGYSNPNFSHFDSAYIWETASPELRYHTGWLGRYLDATDDQTNAPVRAIAVGLDSLPRTLIGENQNGVAMNRLADFSFIDEGRADADLRRRAYSAFGAGASNDSSMRSKVLAAQQGTTAAISAVADASKKVGGTMTPAQTVATMFGAGVGTQVGFIAVGGFDTHTTQRASHAQSLGLVDTAVKEFFDQASKLGLADRATVVTFSEFGRRVEENASEGTDHGSSHPVLVIGPRVNGGLKGAVPDLADLQDGNLKPTTHFSSVYGSVLADAFGVDPAPILGGDFPYIPLIRQA
jgi:uncharacterized protein (DUF1501 family)